MIIVRHAVDRQSQRGEGSARGGDILQGRSGVVDLVHDENLSSEQSAVVEIAAELLSAIVMAHIPRPQESLSLSMDTVTGLYPASDIPGKAENNHVDRDAKPSTHRGEVEPLRSLHLGADRLGDLKSAAVAQLHQAPSGTHTTHGLVKDEPDRLDRDVPLLALVVDLAERPEDTGRDEPSSADRDEERRGCGRQIKAR